MRVRGGTGRALLALAMLCTLLCAAACETAIASGLPEGQANAIVVALDDEGIGAAKEPTVGAGEGWDVLVPTDDVGPSLAVLRALDLPRQEPPGLSEVFGEPTLVPTATEERARWVTALGGELSRSLSTIDGVVDARVHLALPDDRGRAFDDEAPAPRASVLLRTSAGTRSLTSEAQALVSGAVPGLSPEDVAVIAVEASAVTPREASLVRVGPIAVTRGSAPILKAALGGTLGLLALLALALILAWLRLRRTHDHDEAPGAQPV